VFYLNGKGQTSNKLVKADSQISNLARREYTEYFEILLLNASQLEKCRAHNNW
jgi:hypothetical protein